MEESLRKGLIELNNSLSHIKACVAHPMDDMSSNSNHMAVDSGIGCDIESINKEIENDDSCDGSNTNLAQFQNIVLFSYPYFGLIFIHFDIFEILSTFPLICKQFNQLFDSQFANVFGNAILTREFCFDLVYNPPKLFDLKRHNHQNILKRFYYYYNDWNTIEYHINDIVKQMLSAVTIKKTSSKCVDNNEETNDKNVISIEISNEEAKELLGIESLNDDIESTTKWSDMFMDANFPKSLINKMKQQMKNLLVETQYFAIRYLFRINAMRPLKYWLKMIANQNQIELKNLCLKVIVHNSNDKNDKIDKSDSNDNNNNENNNENNNDNNNDSDTTETKNDTNDNNGNNDNNDNNESSENNNMNESKENDSKEEKSMKECEIDTRCKERELFMNECNQFFNKIEQSGKFEILDNDAQKALFSLYDTIEQINIYQWYSYQIEKKDILQQNDNQTNATMNKMHILLYLSIELLQGSVIASQKNKNKKPNNVSKNEHCPNCCKCETKLKHEKNEGLLGLDNEIEENNDNNENDNNSNAENEECSCLCLCKDNENTNDKNIENNSSDEDWYLNSIISEIYAWFLEHDLDANVKSGLLIYLMATFDNNPYVVKYIASVIEYTLEDYTKRINKLSPFVKQDRKEFELLNEECHKYLHAFTNTLQLMTSQNADRWIERKKLMKQHNIGGTVKNFMTNVLKAKQERCHKMEKQEKEEIEIIKKQQRMDERIGQFRFRMEEPQFGDCNEFDENDDFSDIMGYPLIRTPMNVDDGECCIM